MHTRQHRTQPRRSTRLALALGAVTGLTGAAAVTLAPRDAAAQQPIYNGLYYRNLLVGRANPIGLIEDFRFGYRWRFNQGSQDPMYQNQHIALSATMGASPAYARPGVMVEALPLSLLYVFAQYEFVQYFSTFNVPQSFDTPAPAAAGQLPNLNNVGHQVNGMQRVGYSDQALRDYNGPTVDPAVRPYFLNGHQVTLGATFQFRVGDIAIRSAQRWMYVNMNTRNGANGQPQRYYYDITMDMLAQSNGWMFANDTDLLYITSFGLNIGARYSFVQAWHGDDINPGTTDVIDRVGPIITYQVFERRRGRFNAPTFLLAAQWWIRHPYRAGGGAGIEAMDTGSQAIPYILFGLLFRGDS